jgi:hypothetical protein
MFTQGTFAQGKQLIKNKNNKEGFLGDISPITSKLQAQNTTISSTLSDYAENISDFSGAFVSLKTRINNYFDTATPETNHNVFATPKVPAMPANAGGCYPTNSTFMTTATDSKLTNYLTQSGITEQKADAACRTWAYDAGMSLYGINRLAGTGTSAAGAGTGYTCRVGNSDITNLSQYAMDMSYTLMSIPLGSLIGDCKATLSSDGRFGIYDSSRNSYTFLNSTVPSNLALCDPTYGGGINLNTLTASYGYNCNLNVATLPVRKVWISSNVSSITIGQLEIWAMDANGVNRNVAPGKTVSASEAKAIPYEFLNASVKPPATSAIDGKCNSQCFNSGRSKYECYLSIPPSGSWSAYWSLDLGQVYQVNKLVFINNKDNSQLAKNMTIDLKETDTVVKKTIQLSTYLNQTYDMSTP